MIVMSLDSNDSAESNVTMETDNSNLIQQNSWRHIALFFKVVDNKATCTNCSKTLKVQQGTTSNLKIHYQRYHPGQIYDLKAALERASKRGRHKPSQNVAKQASNEGCFKEKFSQKKCLDLYYRSFIGCMKPASETDNEQNKALWAYACPQFKVPSRQKLTHDIRAMGHLINGISDVKDSEADWMMKDCQWMSNVSKSEEETDEDSLTVAGTHVPEIKFSESDTEEDQVTEVHLPVIQFSESGKSFPNDPQEPQMTGKSSCSDRQEPPMIISHPVHTSTPGTSQCQLRKRKDVAKEVQKHPLYVKYMQKKIQSADLEIEALKEQVAVSKLKRAKLEFEIKLLQQKLNE